MGVTVGVNNLSVVHAGSSGVTITFPDVCQTPSPVGPIPIPYPNIAQASDTAKGAKKPRKKRGGLSARDAILKVVGDAGEPVTAGDIIKGAAKLSGGKASSIRTQLGALAKAGRLKPVPYSGRGFKYTKA